MSDTAYDGQLGEPISFTFTPTTGTAFGTAQAQAQELTPQDHRVNKFTFIPISGGNSNQEQYGLTYQPLATIMCKATYKGTEHAAAQTCMTAKIKGSLVVTYGDGATDTYAGSALTAIKGSTINANSERTDDLEFTVPMPPTFAAGS